MTSAMSSTRADPECALIAGSSSPAAPSPTSSPLPSSLCRAGARAGLCQQSAAQTAAHPERGTEPAQQQLNLRGTCSAMLRSSVTTARVRPAESSDGDLSTSSAMSIT